MNNITPTQMGAIRTAYDFENIFPAATAALFGSYGITVATIETITKFQSVRPRINTRFTTGSGKGRYDARFATISRELAWSGTLEHEIVTNSEEKDKLTQAKFAAFLRYIMPSFAALMNGERLPLHKIQNPIHDSGTTLTTKSDKGYWLTNITWNFDFTIQLNAFDNFPTL